MLRLKRFADDNLTKLFGDNWHICLIDNNSDVHTKNNLIRFASHKNINYVSQSEPENLKQNLTLGFNSWNNLNPTIVAVWETDAVPNLNTFVAMIKLFIEERKNNLASVSPMYKWKGQFCYPTHKHWHTDPKYKQHLHFGEITKVHAVPFLFSLWSPESFQYINRGQFRPFVHLDGDFGQFLTDMGKMHLRMKNYHVEHWGGGKMTRG